MRSWAGLIGVVLVLGAATPASSPAGSSAVDILGAERTALAADVAEAARQGDLQRLRSLLAEGRDVNAALGDGMTALHWAAERGDAEMAELLLRAGAQLQSGTRIGAFTPLHVAARAGSTHVVDLLLDADADPGARSTTTGVTPLHLAAEAGDADMIRSLVEHGADVDAPDGGWGQSPLFYAANLDRVEAIRTLTELGADVSMTSRVRDVTHRAAVDEAARDRLNEVLEGFQPPSEETTWRPSPTQVRSAVEAARAVQLRDVVPEPEEAEEGEETEDEREPRRHPVGGWGGLTALLHAARNGHEAAVDALLAAGADINQVSDGDGTSALLITTMNGHWDLALDLLERGADPRLASHAGATPLYAVINLQWAPKTRYPQPRAHEFQETTYLDVMEAFLEAGADPDVRLEQNLWYNWGGRDADGATPFWRAAYGTDLEAMRLLVAYGADPTIPTRAPEPRRSNDDEDEEPEADPSGLPLVPPGGPGTHPIQAASGVGYGENYSEGNIHRHAPDGWLSSVRYLVEELGADVNARDHNGYTALHHAAARGDVPLIRYLVHQGADVMAVSRRGQTTADMANSPGQRLPVHPEAMALLESLGSVNNQNCAVC